MWCIWSLLSFHFSLLLCSSLVFRCQLLLIFNVIRCCCCCCSLCCRFVDFALSLPRVSLMLLLLLFFPSLRIYYCNDFLYLLVRLLLLSCYNCHHCRPLSCGVVVVFSFLLLSLFLFVFVVNIVHTYYVCCCCCTTPYSTGVNNIDFFFFSGCWQLKCCIYHVSSLFHIEL